MLRIEQEPQSHLRWSSVIMKLPWNSLLLLLVAMWAPLVTIHQGEPSQASQSLPETPATSPTDDVFTAPSGVQGAASRTAFPLPVMEASLLAEAMGGRNNLLLWVLPSHRLEATTQIAVRWMQRASCEISERLQFERRVESVVTTTPANREPVTPRATTTPIPDLELVPSHPDPVQIESAPLRVTPVKSPVEFRPNPAPMNRRYRINRPLPGRFWRL